MSRLLSQIDQTMDISVINSANFVESTQVISPPTLDLFLDLAYYDRNAIAL